MNDGIDNYQNSKNLSDADKLAIRYCELMATNPDAIDEAFYDELKKYYSLEEIVELGAFIGLNIGYHTFYGTLDFYPMFSPDGRLIDQEESRKIYGTEVKSLTGRGM